MDEFELHLHPKYQKRFVEKLTELFPKIQFIVSTHSPIPLLGAPPNSVIINVSRTKEEGIKAELLDIDFSVLTPNTILSSPIFGFQDLIPDSKSNDKMIRTEDTYKEVLFHDQLDKQIDEFLTEENKQELLDLLKVK
ncbi:AAA family ATPase [Arcicella sp. DC2W]|uniref:AAA family ATPase n=1 Tax=Arcicella gelida TaxID=2984195 RepID=A0ABU5S8F7_9BACT|nr:AAA family ATPase [Arcicella sp. DC2W]MEA5404746.1 AAA family ATPase [Arcicella sp. DC2W]